MKKSYPVFLTKTYNYILIEVPDFDVLTRGKGTDEAMKIAKNAIELKCVAMEDAGQTMPPPPLEYRRPRSCQKYLYESRGDYGIPYRD